MTFEEWYGPGWDSGIAYDAKEAWEAATKVEREACWNEVNAYIKQGPLDGNGTDETAQRNGLVLASNILFARGVKFND